MMKVERMDIVRLREPKFEELRGNLWFKDNAFEITKINLDILLHRCMRNQNGSIPSAGTE